EQEQPEVRALAQHVAAGLLAEHPSLAEAVPRLLRATGELLGWDAALLWAVDRTKGVLRRAGFWHGPAVEPAGARQVGEQAPYSSGEGLPGRVWAAGEPAWVADVERANFPRAPLLRAAGLRSACALPVELGGEVVCVLELFGAAVRPRDEDLLAALVGIARQVGQSLERARLAAEAERHPPWPRVTLASIRDAL